MKPAPARLLAALLLPVLLTGCVSSKYKRAPKDTPPPAPLNLAIETPAASAALHTVIVFKGPGSWKKAAYWDEYVITLRNSGTEPLVCTGAVLYDVADDALAPGDNPWDLEKLSRVRLKEHRGAGRSILIGTGVTVLWVGSGATAYAAAYGAVLGGGTSVGTAGAIGATAFVAIPVVVIGSGVRTLVARNDITREFERRRAHLPLTVAPGQEVSGSLFFPVAPGPRKLALQCRSGGVATELDFDLIRLGGLHLGDAVTRAPQSP